MNCTDISTYLSTAEGETLNFFGAPPAIALCFRATISTPSGCLRRSITQNFCAPTYFTARQSDVAHNIFFWRMWQYSNHSPNHGHVTPLSQLQRGHLYISPSLRSDFFFFSFFGGSRHPLVVAFFTPPIAHRQHHAAHGSMEPQQLPRPLWAPTRHSGPHPRRRGPLRRTSPPPRPVSCG